MERAFHLTRNDYDRVGHFAQGFVPALVAREIFIRRAVVRSRGWLYAIVVLICLGISAAYELVEWITAISAGSSADAFLGTQGDPWDTQEDMATALVAAMIAPLVMGRWQDRQIAQMTSTPSP
jgi:putative membrane protein